MHLRFHRDQLPAETKLYTRCLIVIESWPRSQQKVDPETPRFTVARRAPDQNPILSLVGTFVSVPVVKCFSVNGLRGRSFFIRRIDEKRRLFPDVFRAPASHEGLASMADRRRSGGEDRDRRLSIARQPSQVTHHENATVQVIPAGINGPRKCNQAPEHAIASAFGEVGGSDCHVDLSGQYHA